MENLTFYKKFYSLENYLFNEVSKNFSEKHYLTSEEFFAIIIWKRNASKTKIRDSVKKHKISIHDLTLNIYKEKTQNGKLNVLISIPNIGISIASAILTVCYPNDFTVVDYRVINSLNKLGLITRQDSVTKLDSYFDYLEKCKSLKDKHNVSLRDIDKILWGMDWYCGKDGIEDLIKNVE